MFIAAYTVSDGLGLAGRARPGYLAWLFLLDGAAIPASVLVAATLV